MVILLLGVAPNHQYRSKKEDPLEHAGRNV